MLLLNCPSCKRPLTLGDNMRGSWVMCPACKTTFQAVVPGAAGTAPVPPPSLVTASPVAPPVPSPPAAPPLSNTPVGQPAQPAGPPPLPPASASSVPNPMEAFLSDSPTSVPIAQPVNATADRAAFTFESEKAQYTRLRIESHLQSAAGWLNLAIFFNFLIGIICVITPMDAFNVRGEGIPLPARLVVTIFFVHLPLILVGFGASALFRRSSYLLAFAGGVTATYLGLIGLFPSLGYGFMLLAAIGAGRAETLFYCVLVFPVALVACVAGLVGGIRTIMVLFNPEINAHFR